MKKITLILAILFVAFSWQSNAQVTIGTGTGDNSNLPINAFYGYSYSQNIYLASEINATGDITEVSFSFNGNSTLTNSVDWVVYIGHTTKTDFTSTTDWIDVTTLTEVYNGTISAVGAGTDELITIDITDFTYNGTDNLVIAVEDNTSDYDSGADNFYSTDVGTDRSIIYFNDNTNPDPLSPPAASAFSGVTSNLANVILGGITQTCPVPSAIIPSGMTTTDVTLNWTDNASASEWEYVIQAAGAAAPTGSGTSVMATSVTDMSLSASTSYDVYVRAICSTTDASAWADPVSFVTQCTPFGDFTENFDATTDGELTLCWSSFTDSTDAGTRVTAEDTDPNSGANAVELFNSGDDGSELMLISPNLTDMQNADHRIRFMAKGTGADPAVLVGTMTDPTDSSTFAPITGIDLTGTYAPYSLVIDNPPAGANYIAFQHGHGATFQTLRIDDFVWEPTPSCVEPSDIFINAVTASGATVAWTENNTTAATNWDLYIVPAGDPAPDAASTPTMNDETDNAGATWAGGTANTAYDVYVRADCGADNTDVSTWTGPASFTTSCSTFMAPYTEDFEDGGAIDACWTQATDDNFDWSGNSGGTTSGSTGPSAANSGTYYIYTETSPVAVGDIATIYSPNIDITALTTPRLNFAYHMYGAGMDPDGNIDVAISTDGGATYASIFNEVGNHGDQWNNALIDLAAYTGVVSFKISGEVAPTSTGTFYTNDFAIDDFKVEETPAAAPNCAVVVATDTDAACGDRGVSLAWAAVTGATGYKITAGTTAGGNDIADDQDLSAGLSFEIPSTPNTDYFYTITPYNAIGDAVCTEASFTSFATGCICVSNPSSNDGDGVTNTQIGTNDYVSFGDVTYEDHTGGVVTDLEQVISNNLQITFATGWTYGTNVWIDFNDDNVLDDATELVFSGESTNANPTTLDASFVIAAGAVEGIHSMRIGTADSGQGTPNACYNGSYGVTLDFKVNILAPPTCLPPTALAASNITDVSADLAWMSGGSGETMYDIEIVDVTAGGTALGTATYTDEANPYSLTGLTESNDYQYYVRANCGGSDYSIWVGPFDFSTVASCIMPSDLLVSNIDSAAGTADFSWTDSNPTAPMNGWEYEIVDVSASGTATGTGVATATNPVSVTNLVDGNQYEFLVRAVCGAPGSESAWSTAYAWTQMDLPGCVSNPTPADAATDVALGLTTFMWDMPATGGIVDSYDVYGGLSATTMVLLGNTTTLTFDYALNAYGTTYHWQVIPKNDGGEATGCDVYTLTTIAPPGCGDAFTDFNGATADYSINENRTWTMTPDTAGEVVTVTFTAFGTENCCDHLYVYDGPDNTFPLIGQFQGTTIPGPFTSSDASGTLTFVFTSDVSVQGIGWEADVTCAAPPICADPTNGVASNITDLAADLSWDENGTPPAMGWDIEWGEAAGFVQGAGTMVTNTADNPYMLSGLTALTDYVFYVKSNCALPYESAWAGPFAFSTIATPSCLLPTTLTATNVTDLAADLGWTEVNTVAATAWDVEWGPAGFTQTAGTMITATANNPESISGLTAETAYEFYVRAICSASDSSGWAGPFAFTTMATPPVNDNCVDAIALTVGPDFATEMVVGTNVGATDSGELAPGCASYLGGDVWFSVEVPSDGTLTLEVNTATGGITDGAAAAYSGTCGNFTLIGCNDSASGAGDDQPLITINDTALAGQTIYFRVWEYGNNSFGAFNVSAYNPNVVATNDLATVGFNYYPNPVTNSLTMTANENITSVRIFNMLGQEVRNEKLSTLEASIDMSNLSNGTYFVKAQVGQTVGTFKIVKK